MDPNFEGIDLRLDANIQKICEMANKSTSSSRSVLYVVILTSILALIAVINTHKGNWAKHRENTELSEIRRLKKAMLSSKDSMLIADTMFVHRILLDRLITAQVEHVQTISVPILGNSFDINNLSLVVGISFLVLLVILRFTLNREHCNLVIALNAITERYSDAADSDKFIRKSNHLVLNDEQSLLLVHLNKTRRKHHYNYLSMNDIFTLPSIKISGVEHTPTVNQTRTITLIFWLPFVVYCIIVLNDILTGYDYIGNKFHTWITIVSGLVLTMPLLYISYRCYSENQQMLKEYDLFKLREYKFNKLQ